MRLEHLILGFAVYSFLGWLCESTYCSIPAKKFINRGFLNGPFCPVYGFGALLVIFLLSPYEDSILALFLCGIVVTSALEYITGLLLEKCFHTKWWDYSKRRFNLHGRVCLRNSVMFGVLSVLVMKLIHPPVKNLIDAVPASLLPVLSYSLLFYFVVDSIITVHTILALNGKLKQLQKVFDEIKEKSEEHKRQLQQAFEERMPDELRDSLERLDKLRTEMAQNTRFLHRRLMNAFPNMRSIRHNEPLRQIKEALEERRLQRKRNRKK